MDNVLALDDDAPLVSTTVSSPPTIETIVDAIAAARETQPMDLSPLHESVDTVALERVLGTSGGGRVSFRYEDLLVAADADGTVEVYDRS